MISILEEKRNTLILLSKMLLSVIRKKGNRKVLVYLFIVYHVSLLLLCNVVMLCTIALNFSCLCTLNYYLTAKSLGYNKNNCKFA